jgi:hypothetical protein
MNTKMHRNIFLRGAQIFAVLLAGFFLLPALRAQPTEETVQSRFLFIFDTSKEMKPRLDYTERALNTLLATSGGGQLHTGDSMGVWTFNQSLQTKGYPLQSWNPEAAVTIASNLVKFVGNQSYAKNTHFEALQPALNRVVQNSERLTVLIFCDGEGKIGGTPYDAAINQVFKEKLGDQKSAQEPFIVVLRSQLGQYVGATLALSPQPVRLPPFPPLPEPPAPPAPKPVYVPPPPVVMGQPLIIIGKKPATIEPPPATNAPPMVATNASVTPTNPAAAKIILAAPPNAPTVSPENSNAGNRGFLIIGAALFGAAIALGMMLWLRPRGHETSLITRSMNDRK